MNYEYILYTVYCILGDYLHEYLEIKPRRASVYTRLCF